MARHTSDALCDCNPIDYQGINQKSEQYYELKFELLPMM